MKLQLESDRDRKTESLLSLCRAATRWGKPGVGPEPHVEPPCPGSSMHRERKHQPFGERLLTSLYPGLT